MMGLWASGLRSLRPLASTHSVPRLTTPSFSPHINPFRKNSKLKQNILWFGLSFVQISCRKIRSFPFLINFHSFLPKRVRKYHTIDWSSWFMLWPVAGIDLFFFLLENKVVLACGHDCRKKNNGNMVLNIPASGCCLSNRLFPRGSRCSGSENCNIVCLIIFFWYLFSFRWHFCSEKFKYIYFFHPHYTKLGDYFPTL